jgi:hypothetical protein
MGRAPLPQSCIWCLPHPQPLESWVLRQELWRNLGVEWDRLVRKFCDPEGKVVDAYWRVWVDLRNWKVCNSLIIYPYPILYDT